MASIITKSEQIRIALKAGDNKKAISIASKFWDKSPRTKKCQLAQSAILSPAFMRQLGKNPQQLIDDAIAALQDEFLIKGGKDD